jgi:hypothetical protein
MANKSAHIIGGGTISHVRSHLALCAPAYGTTARTLAALCEEQSELLDVHLHLTKMAGGDTLETNDDVVQLVNRLTADYSTKIVFMNTALTDYTGAVVIDGEPTPSGKYATRLQSRVDTDVELRLTLAEKIVGDIRKQRKDIFGVAFKTTSGATEDEQYIAGLRLLKGSSSNLVLANDLISRVNMIITPEESRYHVTTDREEALYNLVEMAYLRSHLTFTRSTVVAGEPVPWRSELVPETLREVVDYCVEAGAYKAFNGATVGHFAAKVNEHTFLTSRRKTNFNEIDKIGLVRIVTDGPDSILAYGSRPSVGGQSQRIIFTEHPEYDCIVHFHCPKKESSAVPTVSQREYECGSHQCGQNTSRGLQQFGNLSAVYLDQHGPNIVFNRSIDPQEVMRFIDENFDLSKKTGGYVTLPA